MFNTERVFVYGTLRTPTTDTPPEDTRYHPQVAGLIKSSEPAHLEAAQMFDLGSYPAIVRGAGGVLGEVLTVPPQALKIMDRIEGHPTFFKREQAKVQTELGTALAWVYWAPKGLTIGRCRIESGDWFARDRSGITDCADNNIALQSIDETLRQAIQRFAQAECSWFSSVRADGRAHCVPVWHVWFRGRGYVVTPGGSVKVANINLNPSVVISHQDPVNPVIVEGWAVVANHMQTQLQPCFNEKYNWDLFTDEEYDTIIEITPTKLMAWGEHGQGRWPGEEVVRVWAVS